MVFVNGVVRAAVCGIWARGRRGRELNLKFLWLSFVIGEVL